MNNPTVVFDPYATVDLRNVVQRMVDYHIVAFTGKAGWYPVHATITARKDETKQSDRTGTAASGANL
jgi:hypothetical protein